MMSDECKNYNLKKNIQVLNWLRRFDDNDDDDDDDDDSDNLEN